MENAWLKRWNDRYREKEYAYGKEPNQFLKVQLDKLKPGTILFPAEGEGRNAVYAAKTGWKAFAFDTSTEGRKKAMQLAEENKVFIDYQVGELPNLNYSTGQFDVIALIYAHFPPDIRSDYHKLLDNYLKKGGKIIFEAFGKKNLKYRKKNAKIGGPLASEALFSIDALKADFEKYHVLELVEKEVRLSEGLYHNGTGSVVRFVGTKL